VAASKSTEPRPGYIHGTSASETDRLAALNHPDEQFVGFVVCDRDCDDAGAIFDWNRATGQK